LLTKDRLQKCLDGIEALDAASLDGPVREVRVVGELLEREQIAEPVVLLLGADALHAFKHKHHIVLVDLRRLQQLKVPLAANVERDLVVVNLFLELGDLEEALQVVPLALEDQLADKEDLFAVFEELCVRFFLEREQRLAQVLFFEVVLDGQLMELPG
jgi:hypothetical protein